MAANEDYKTPSTATEARLGPFLAFISYRHVEPDRKWAKWLHRRMESYRVPHRLAREHQLPRRVGPIFRDEEELAASSDLSAGIRQALDASNYLIVVCSPRTPASRWVDAEVDHFKKLGRGDHVLALLIEGEPAEAFPRSLRTIRPAAIAPDPALSESIAALEPLAADVRPSTSEGASYRRRMATLRLLATVLGCRFDDLRQREQERRTRVLVYVVAALALLASIIAGLGFLAETNRERAVAERDRALRNQSMFVAGLARRETNRGDTTAGMLLALEALPRDARRHDRPLVPEALEALYQAILARRELAVFRPAGELSSAALGHDGQRVLTVSSEGGARLWDAASGAALAVLGNGGIVAKRAEFNPDGSRILTTDETGPAHLWDARSGTELALIGEGAAPVSRADFSPDGTRILTLSKLGAQLWNSQSAKLVAGFGLALATPQSFSADGSRILSFGLMTGDVRLWSATSGKELSQFRDVPDIFIPTLSADGTRILTWSMNGAARVWDADSARQLSLLREPSYLQWAELSLDGSRVVTFAGDGAVRLWDASSGHDLALLVSDPDFGLIGPDTGQARAVFSPDQTRLVTEGRLFNAATGQKLGDLSGDAHAVFSPTSERLVTYGGRAILWDAAGKQLAVLPHEAPTAQSHTIFGPGGSVKEVAFSPDGSRILTASEDGTARLWGSADGVELAVFRGHDAPVGHAAFSADGQRILTTSADGTARLWDAGEGPEVSSVRGQRGPVRNAVFSADGSRLLIASGDRTVRPWIVADGRQIAVLGSDQSEVNQVAFDIGGRRIAIAFADGTVRVLDAATGTELSVLRGHEKAVERAVFSGDGERLLTLGGDYRAVVWNVSTGVAQAVLQHEGGLYSAEISVEGTRVLTTAIGPTGRPGDYRRMAYLWDMPSGTKLATFREVGSALSMATFSPDGSRVLTAAENGVARLWAAADGRELTMLPQHENFVPEAAFTADGRRLLTVAYDRVALLLDAASGREIARLQQAFGVRHIRLAADGARALTLSPGVEPPRVWDTASGNQIASLTGHEGFIQDAALGPNGRHAVTFSQSDGTARLWDTDTGHQLAVLRSADRIDHAAFSPDGTRVLIVSSDGIARLFPVFATAEAVVAHARAVVPRKFSERDRQRYFLSRE
jgi:WD40 repeat protein